MLQMKIKLKKLHDLAVAPEYATKGAACFDLRSVESGNVITTNKFRTGLAFDVPEGQVMLIFSRSGHGFNGDIRLANCTGVIDSDYVGEVMVKLTSDGATVLEVKPGDRIAQAMFIPVQQVEQFEFVDELKQTDRGEGGFGSTGK